MTSCEGTHREEGKEAASSPNSMLHNLRDSQENGDATQDKSRPPLPAAPLPRRQGRGTPDSNTSSSTTDPQNPRATPELGPRPAATSKHLC